MAQGPKCAVCGKLVVQAFKPFCSARCKQIDLNRWLTESYRVPAGPVDDEEDGPPRSEDETE